MLRIPLIGRGLAEEYRSGQRFEDLDEDAKKKLGPDGNGNVLAACIGTTSARACLESGRWHATDIYYPKEDPGVESWAQSAAQAVADTLERKFWA